MEPKEPSRTHSKTNEQFRKLRKDLQNMKIHLAVVNQSITMKDDIIKHLQDDIRGKDSIIDSQLMLLRESQASISGFYRVLQGLKEARTKSDVQDVLNSFEVNLDHLPSVH